MSNPTHETAPTTAPAARNSCGDCTVCCTVMKVRELNKGANTPCVHCTAGTGCNIYNARPESCRVYECLWFRSQAFDKPLPAHIRPDRCKVVIGTVNNGNEAILYVDPTHRDAWREPAFSDALGLFCSRGIPVYVSCNDQITRIF
jgi:hypothetical protein